MYQIGKPEIDAVARVIERGRMFRYFEPSECARFEERYAEYLGVEHVVLCSSGTAALVAAMVGLGIGPCDEVAVPAVTYMATATAVLAVGAIPLLVDVDESLTMDPRALDAAVGPRTRAVIPVHMWGLSCDMHTILDVARRRQLLVVEDACQAVGGGYEGRMLGSLGRAGAFSFNYFKNITCGEGGAACTNDASAFERMRCAVDCCNFYWNGQPDGFQGFAANSSRASELEGAVLQAQLDRLPQMMAAMRGHKHKVLAETGDVLLAAPSRSLDYECGTHAVFQFSSGEEATRFANAVGGAVVNDTGRHVYTRWTPVLEQRGAHHPALDPFKLRENAECRKQYSAETCARSLDIAARTVIVPLRPDFSDADLDALIRKLRAAARH
jgi:dTDP-4-amino-4,6-dideoxygalactose transaminase